MAEGEYHWKVCEPNFESYRPTAMDPYQVAIESERERGKVLRVRFPDDAANAVVVTPRLIRAIIEAAESIGWGAACAEPGYWLGHCLANYAQWVDELRAKGH